MAPNPGGDRPPRFITPAGFAQIRAEYEQLFGTERPKGNLNHGAGLDVSPAIRDYLGLGPTDVTSWRFVDENEVPAGPWRQYGENNPFVQRQAGTRMVKIATSEGALKAIVNSGARSR